MAEIELKEINELLKNPTEAISVADREYHDFVKSLAERVVSSDKIRIVLLAGPSGSGKTTTANMLSDEIKSRGFDSLVISLDDFYRNWTDPNYPRLENGELNFECPEALDLPTLIETLSDIADGNDFTVPRYDFKKTKRVDVVKYPKIEHGCVVIEGLHALNPKIFTELPTEKLLKVFISVSTNVSKNGERILSGRKVRFMRRMVRDYIYRGASCEDTLEFWTNVLVGEDKYLYPFRDCADVSYNTFHSFELGIMKPYVISIISDTLADSNEYLKTVRESIKDITPIDESFLPETSLIREFIPGGKYDHLY